MRMLSLVNRVFGKVGLHVSSTRPKNNSAAELEVYKRSIQLVMERFPFFKQYDHPSIYSNINTSLAFLEFINAYLPILSPNSTEAYLRTLLTRLKKSVHDPDLRLRLEIEIARSNLKDGVCERSLLLLQHPEMVAEEELEELNKQVLTHDKNYSAVAGMIASLEDWRKIPGDIRGASLIAFFSQNEKMLENKSILHIAPENTTNKWFLSKAKKLNFSYTTLDPFRNTVDIKQDICSLKLPANSIDLIICHRVLEHIPDDRSALRELSRILKPNGILHFSVPQSLNIEKTSEWLIQDESHDLHVRQYGLDLEERLREANLTFEVEQGLLNKSKHEHLKQGTYPMRIYLCSKSS